MDKNLRIRYSSSMHKKVDSGVDRNVFKGKDVTEMNPEELKAHFVSSGIEFSTKMEENFKCYVFIAANTGMQNLDEVMENMNFCGGYKMHKTVGCFQRIYHLYVKYNNESIATGARDFFRTMGLSSELVSDMLSLWYACEKASGLTKCQTTGFLTVSNDTYLTSESADLALRKYGNPDIKAVIDKSVKVSFNSVAEAFGACIALGPWYFNNMLVGVKFCSLKIQLSNHCFKVMRMCDMTNVASEFDYFVQNNPYVYPKSNKGRSFYSNKAELEKKQNDPNVYPKSNKDRSFYSNKAELEKKVEVHQSKKPKVGVLRNPGSGRIVKRENYGIFTQT